MKQTTSGVLHIRGGKVFDPDTRTFRVRDVSVSEGKITRIAEDLPRAPGAEELDARGKLILPGLVDFHLHCYLHGQILGVDADEIAPRAGTTAFVDAGSCGAINYSGFREFVVKPAAAKIFAFLNVSALGQHALGVRGIDVHEYEDERFLRLDAAAEVIEGNRDGIVGVKVRMCAGNFSAAPLEAARKLADAVRLPLMVHIGSDTVPLETVLASLKEGDIVTHVYHGGSDSILDAKGEIRPAVLEARKRGIMFDVGLDRVHSSFAVIKPALGLGFYPDFISTDLAAVNRHVTMDMPTTISKFLALGLPLEEAVHRSAATAARKLNRPEVSGELREGLQADIGVFDLEEGEFIFKDTYGNSVRGTKRLAAAATILDGSLLERKPAIPPPPGFIAP